MLETVLYRFLSSAVIPVEENLRCSREECLLAERHRHLPDTMRCGIVRNVVASRPGSEVERVRRFQLEPGHLLLHDPTAATM